MRLFVLLVAPAIGCGSPGDSPGGDVADESDGPREVADAAPEVADVAPEVADVAPEVPPAEAPRVVAVAPALADVGGGGGRIVIALSSSSGVTGAALGDAPLASFSVDDATHVSGVPGAHAAGLVDVTVAHESGAHATGEGLFEYWSPRQIAGLDAYLDVHDGLALAGARIERWTDRGPYARVFAQPDPARRPRLEGGAVVFERAQFLRLDAPVALAETGTSVFAVASWRPSTATAPESPGDVPLTLLGDGTNGYGAFGATGGAITSNHYVGGPVYVTRGADLDDGRVRLIGASYDTTTITRIYLGSRQLGVDDNSAPLVGANTYDRIGAGLDGQDGWNGTLHALVVAAGEVAVSDREKLDRWAEQRFATPRSPPLDGWVRAALGEMPPLWHPRDGAQMTALASGRILFIGGWSAYDPWDGARVTNEVWASDDRGATWGRLLAHDPGAPRFPPGHTVGVASIRGYALVLGSEALRPPYLGEVWRSNEDGTTWTRVTGDAPTLGRCLFMVGVLGDDLYVMGGQTNLADPTSGITDVWRSRDGGVTWEALDPPPWSPRGMVYRPVAAGGRLFVVGGGLYADASLALVAFNGVFAFDGERWATILPDGHGQWRPSYYNAVAALDDRLWLFNGFSGTEDLVRTLASDDLGLTWHELPGGPGGNGSHADATLAIGDRVLRVSGNLSERRIYVFRRR